MTHTEYDHLTNSIKLIVDTQNIFSLNNSITKTYRNIYILGHLPIYNKKTK